MHQDAQDSQIYAFRNDLCT